MGNEIEERWRYMPASLAVALFVLLNLLAAVGLSRLQINNAPEVYLDADLPVMALKRQIETDFPQDQVLVVLFEGVGLFEDRFINGLEHAVDVIERDKHVDRVVTLVSVDHISGSEDEFVVEPLLEADRLEGLTEQQRRDRVLSDRFAPGLVVSKDGSAVALIVRPLALGSSFERVAVVDLVESAIADAGLAPWRTAMAGHVALDVAQLRAMIGDTLKFVPITTFFGMLLIWWLYRRWLAVVVTAVTVGTVASLAVVVLVLFDRPYTLVTSMIPSLMSALTIAFLIHLFNALKHASLRGMRGRQCMDEALNAVVRPGIYACLTTAAGMFSLTFSGIVPIQSFGLAAGVGVLLILPVVVWLLPPILLAYEGGGWQCARKQNRLMAGWVFAMVRLAIRRAGWVVAGIVAALLAGIPLVMNIHAETDLYKFFKDDHPLTQSTRHVSEKLVGVTTLEVIFDAPVRDGLKDPDRLKALVQFRQWLLSQPEVDRVFCMSDVVEEMNWAFNGEQPEFRRVPDDPLLIGQYLMIYSGKDLYELVDDRFQRTRVTLNLNVTGSGDVASVVERIKGRLTSQPVADLKWQISGFGQMFVEQERLLVKGQLSSLWVAVLVIFAMLLVLWRSLSDAVLTMVPNIAPIVLIFIVMGALGIWLDMATAMISSVALGVAVDDTVHIYHGFKDRLRRGMAPVAALMRTYAQAGQAVMATTIVLCVQLSVLGFSDFVPTVEFGLLTAFGLLVALLFDLVLLPAILILVHSRQPKVAARI